MTDQPLNLGTEFQSPTEEDWRGLVEKALKGADYEKTLVTTTYDGYPINPLYTERDWPSAADEAGLPGSAPLTRGMHAIGPTDPPWDIRTYHSHPDPSAANKAILEDFEGGATSIELMIDPTGEHGICVQNLSDLEDALQGVFLDMAPITLTARGSGLAAATLLAALWKKRGISNDKALGAFNINPISTGLATGRLPCGMEEALGHVAKLAAHVSATYPNVSTISVDARITNDGGATGPQGIGNALSTGLAYLRAMTDVGMSIEEAASQISLTLVTDANFYESIVKVRVARKLWGRIILESGGDLSKVNTKIHVENVSRTMTKRDPWVNILRTTVAAFGAALGGTDSISVLPFTHALGQPTSFARRVARNSQIILAEESNLGRVMDPAGGSWAIEKFTDDYARTGWGYFQDIEGQGGIVAAIRSGWLQSWIAKAKDDRSEKVATRKLPITGVSEFPDLHEAAVAFETVDTSAIAEKRRKPASGVDIESTTFDNLVSAAEAGATLGELMAPFETKEETFITLTPYRLAEDFEALRDASDAHLERTGSRPQIFLANMGTIADFTARATFAKNFFEAGGIEAPSNEGFETPVAAADAFAASNTTVAILCSSDGKYAENAKSFAKTLRAKGVNRLYLAGQPGDRRETLEAAGVDEFIHIGSNVLDVLTRAHETLGVKS